MLTRKSTAVGLVLVMAAIGVPAWGYINGGDRKTGGGNVIKQLVEKGWGVATYAELPQSDRDQQINLVVARAAQELEKVGVDMSKLSIDDKRAIARSAKQSLEKGKLDGIKVLTEEVIGAFRYQIGIEEFTSYWETNYGGKRETHAFTRRYVLYVALQSAEKGPNTPRMEKGISPTK